MRRVHCAVLLAAAALAAFIATPAAQSAVGTFRRVVYGTDARTIADNGSSTPATLTLTPAASLVKVRCEDTQYCAVTMGEAGGISQGFTVNLVVLDGSSRVKLIYSAGAAEIKQAVWLNQFDAVTLQYVDTGFVNAWVLTGRHDTALPFTSEITLTDTQIKAAPTTAYFEVVPAAPSGYTNKFLGGMIVGDFAAGAYTNVGTVFSANVVGFEMNGGNGYGSLYLHNDTTLGYNTFHDFFTTATKHLVALPVYAAAVDPTDVGDAGQGWPQAFADYDGNIALLISNNLGNFTGGNAANYLTAIVDYRVIQTP